MSTSVLHGQKEAWGRGMWKKAPYLWINFINQQYSPFCRKIKIQLNENPSPMQTRTHTQINRFCFKNSWFLIILHVAKFYQKFPPKCKLWVSKAQRFFFFFLLTDCSKFAQACINQIALFQFQNTKYSSFWGCTSPLKHSLCAKACNWRWRTQSIEKNVKDKSTPLHYFFFVFNYC